MLKEKEKYKKKRRRIQFKNKEGLKQALRFCIFCSAT
jgi:hypothetical protein